MRAVVHCDGASSGNPGPSGIGAVVEFSGTAYEIAEPIGTATNNIAEYTSLVRSLERSLDLGADEAEVYMDSELVVKQMKGEYKVRNKGLMPLYKAASLLSRKFRSFSISHVPREENKHADKLSKKALEPSDTPPPGDSSSGGPSGQGALPF